MKSQDLPVNDGLLVNGHAQIGVLYKVFFIVIVVLGLYYPSIFSDFNSIDDSHIISFLEDTDFKLLDVILPGRSHYYRPVVWLSYFFDKYAWGLTPSFMHLDNIVFHLINALLVYALAHVLAGSNEKRLELPLLSGLLFAVHPINTEAVCWVAGRTDQLATIFILLAALVVARSKFENRFFMLYMSAFLIFLGCLAKEVAFFFFPLALVAAIYKCHSHFFISYATVRWKVVAREIIPFIFFPLFYLFLRKAALPAEDNSVAILASQTTTIMTPLLGGLKAFGFYVKKLLLPMPLDFAIISYSSGYLYLGITAVLLLVLLILKRRTYYFLIFCSLCLIFPALIVAVKPIAWTPVAERYLYAPASLFVPGVIGSLCYYFNNRKYEVLLPGIIILLITVSSFFTVQRTLVWQDNYLLYKDTVAKSPEFARIRNEYGVALALRGDNLGASKQFEAGKMLAKSYHLPVLNLANIKINEGKLSEALEILNSSYKDKSVAPTDILKLQARIYESQLLKSTIKTGQQNRLLKLIEIYEVIYQKTDDPYIAYRTGQLLLAVAKPGDAAVYFEKAYRDAPENSFYKQAAKKLSFRLKEKK